MKYVQWDDVSVPRLISKFSSASVIVPFRWQLQELPNHAKDPTGQLQMALKPLQVCLSETSSSSFEEAWAIQMGMEWRKIWNPQREFPWGNQIDQIQVSKVNSSFLSTARAVH